MTKLANRRIAAIRPTATTATTGRLIRRRTASTPSRAGGGAGGSSMVVGVCTGGWDERACARERSPPATRRIPQSKHELDPLEHVIKRGRFVVDEPRGEP